MKAILAKVRAWLADLRRRAFTPVEQSEEDEYWDQHFWQAW